MKNLINKNKIILKKTFLIYKKKQVLNLILNLRSFKFKLIILNRLKLFFNFLNSKFHKQSHLNRFKKYCLLTARSKSIYNLFCLSRLKIKELAWKGILTGVKKFSW